MKYFCLEFSENVLNISLTLVPSDFLDLYACRMFLLFLLLPLEQPMPLVAPTVSMLYWGPSLRSGSFLALFSLFLYFCVVLDSMRSVLSHELTRRTPNPTADPSMSPFVFLTDLGVLAEALFLGSWGLQKLPCNCGFG